MVYQRIRLTLHVVGSFLKYVALIYLFPLAVAIYLGEDWHIFLYSLLITLAIGLLLEFGFKTNKEIERADGFSIVAFTWFLVPIFGMIPYIFLGLHPVDAFFESVSGFTTTGATILEVVEALPKSALLWRSLTAWLGGMGVITLFIAVLPKLEVGGSQLIGREYSTPLPERLRPRVRTTARLLWSIYVGFTAAEIALLYFAARLSLFDSINISFCTLPACGFTPITAGIGGYANPLAEYIIMAFMLAAGTNFLIHYHVWRGKLKVLKDEEFRLYLIILAVATSLLIFSQGLSSYRYGLFQAISIMTGTGFATTNFGAWNFGARMVLLTLMFIGACGGSTGGGIKVIRAFILLRFSRIMMSKVLSPKAVIPVKYDEKPLSDEIIRGMISFVFLYFLVFMVASIALGFLGADVETAISAVATCQANCGPGLGAVGPAFNYFWLPVLGKIVLAIVMWLGRLEIFTVIMMFFPRYWKG